MTFDEASAMGTLELMNAAKLQGLGTWEQEEKHCWVATMVFDDELQCCNGATGESVRLNRWDVALLKNVIDGGELKTATLALPLAPEADDRTNDSTDSTGA